MNGFYTLQIHMLSFHWWIHQIVDWQSWRECKIKITLIYLPQLMYKYIPHHHPTQSHHMIIITSTSGVWATHYYNTVKLRSRSGHYYSSVYNHVKLRSLLLFCLQPCQAQVIISILSSYMSSSVRVQVKFRSLEQYASFQDIICSLRPQSTLP